ncbi:hypothetical protein FGRMN_1397 [Fusarium graminum]|nr:hypothetical protein FGRMN_1397 [Fusarium graminum]
MSTSSCHKTAKGRPNSKPPGKAAPRAPKRARTEADESDETSGRNRHRVTRACNECRRRKDRCGGQRPSCTSCLEGSRTCSYGPSKKRGLRPGYVRAIEALLGLIFTTVDGSETYINGLLVGDAQQTSMHTATTAVHESEISTEYLLEAWRKCSVAKEVGKLLASGGVEDDEDGTDSTQYFDLKVAEALAISLASRNDHPGAPLTPMNTESTPQGISLFEITSPPGAAHPTSDRIESPPQACLNQRAEPTVLRSVDVPSTSIPELPGHWPFLLDLYFETTHSWLPFSQKHELLRAAYTLADNTSATSINPPSSGELAFLHAVLLYSAHQSALLPYKLDSQTDNAYNLMSSHDLIRTTLFGDPSTYDLGHIRAFIVLSLFEMENKVWTTAWAYIGRAIYTVISPLNDLSPPRKVSASEGRLQEIIRASYQNIGELGEQRSALDVPPQTLCLWIASVTTIETAGAQLLLSYGSNPGRPEGYMANAKWLTSLAAERFQTLGCCSVPLVAEACLTLLQKSLARQQLFYVGNDIADEFIVLQKSISALLGLLQNPDGKPIQSVVAYNSQGHSINMFDRSLQSKQPTSTTFIHSLPQANITSEVVSSATIDLGRSLKTIDLTMLQNESPTAVTSQHPKVGIDPALLPARSPLGDEIDDDGLFDSLATLDSTDWMANPPEFMQHLGYMENQANDLEAIFDLGFGSPGMSS